jgi:hypothetical protein
MKSYGPILDELHKVKDAIAKAHDYDVDKLFACVRAREGKPSYEPCPHMPKSKRPSRSRKAAKSRARESS